MATRKGHLAKRSGNAKKKTTTESGTVLYPKEVEITSDDDDINLDKIQQTAYQTSVRICFSSADGMMQLQTDIPRRKVHTFSPPQATDSIVQQQQTEATHEEGMDVE
jgi:hypothetical protein